MKAALELAKVSFSRGARNILIDVDLTIEPGSTLVLMGPSGSGKSTLLRLIAGFEKPASGVIHIGGLRASTPRRIEIAPEARNVALVSQDLGLWPHMSVTEHLEFALTSRGVGRTERIKRIQVMIESVALEGRETHRPAALSGGEQQRLALARALIVEPSLILFDEPTRNLDAELKDDILKLIRALLRREKIAAIYVTHDRIEARSLDANIARLEDGVLTLSDGRERAS
jgi:ABC-type sugar transport system ATPase subunit